MFLVVPITLVCMERTLAEVGKIVTQRRNELHMDAAELARVAGVDPKTLASLEKGERWPRDKSRSRIEDALKWTAGSLSVVRRGGTPSMSGVIRDRSGRAIQEFTAIEGAEQEELELLRLASIVLDARDLVRAQKGPLMTALASVLDEAADLVTKLVARPHGNIENARWFIDETRAGTTIRRQGEIYVIDDATVQDQRSSHDSEARASTGSWGRWTGGKVEDRDKDAQQGR